MKDKQARERAEQAWHYWDNINKRLIDAEIKIKELEFQLNRQTLLKDGWTTEQRESWAPGTYGSIATIVTEWIPPKGRGLAQIPLSLKEAIKLNEMIEKKPEEK